MITFESVYKRFADGTVAADDLSFEVPEGELVVLVGPSGCGKTTALRMVNRMIEPTEGRISVNGQDAAGVPAPKLRRDIGYVIQQVGAVRLGIDGKAQERLACGSEPRPRTGGGADERRTATHHVSPRPVQLGFTAVCYPGDDR